jgi:RNA polymerase sigma-70 factor (ECF subfamily)
MTRVDAYVPAAGVIAARFAEDPDVQRMLRLRAGDALAFDELLETHRRPIVRLIYRMTQNAAIAEELAQEVFLRVYRARERYEPAASFKTWIYRIAVNRTRNWIRDNSEQSWREESLERERPDDMPRQFVDPSPSPEIRLLAADGGRRLKELLTILPDRQRDAVLLHKFEDLSYSEIAVVLGCSVPALKSLLFRAYATLRQRLEQDLQYCPNDGRQECHPAH